MSFASRSISAIIAIIVLTLFSFTAAQAQSNVSKPPPPPAASIQTLDSQSDFWNQIRHGAQGKGGQLIQSQGEDWRLFRNGPLKQYTSYGMLGMVILLALFFLIRGRIKIDHGWSGFTIERFNMLERCGHWILAVSFIILALTGLNVTFGKYVLLPVIGKEAFGTISIGAKYLHNYVAFAFILGLVWVLVAWIKDNFPRMADLKWFLMGGGVLVKGIHPPAHKFNAGQKIIFWLVILTGVSISLSGWALLFPFETAMFAKTFAFINSVAGTDYPTQLSAIQEQQYAVTWHNMMAIFMICVILAHIYIGSVGMQGAFDAMGSGRVDLNWAKEHHSLWVEKLEREDRLGAERDENRDAPDEVDEAKVKAQPAE
ncbi:MAG: formate dehydrogenase subunit gamma [Pseudomonadota bacterium]